MKVVIQVQDSACHHQVVNSITVEISYDKVCMYSEVIKQVGVSDIRDAIIQMPTKLIKLMSFIIMLLMKFTWERACQKSTYGTIICIGAMPFEKLKFIFRELEGSEIMIFFSLVGIDHLSCWSEKKEEITIDYFSCQARASFIWNLRSGHMAQFIIRWWVFTIK